jgi:hypothetical protein
MEIISDFCDSRTKLINIQNTKLYKVLIGKCIVHSAFLTYIYPCIANISLKTTNKMQRFLDLFISINCCTCFRRFLHPSSGAQNCTYSVRYCQTNPACCYRGLVGTEFHLIYCSSSIGLTITDAVCTVLCF